MADNLISILSILTILGVSLGALAIALSIEVAKRCYGHVEQHKLDINVHLAERMRQQDQELKAMIKSVNSTMDEMAEKTDVQLGQIRALGNQLNIRICRQDAQFDVNLATLRETVASLEQSRNAHEDQLSEVKYAVGMMARKAKKPASRARESVTHS